MNTSLKFGILAILILLISYFILPMTTYSLLLIIISIILGIISFILSIKEIKNKGNKVQAISGLIIGIVIGIFPPLAWLSIVVLISSGAGSY